MMEHEVNLGGQYTRGVLSTSFCFIAFKTMSVFICDKLVCDNLHFQMVPMLMKIVYEVLWATGIFHKVTRESSKNVGNNIPPGKPPMLPPMRSQLSFGELHDKRKLVQDILTC
jgi:hypothetical protein